MEADYIRIALSDILTVIPKKRLAPHPEEKLLLRISFCELTTLIKLHVDSMMHCHRNPTSVPAIHFEPANEPDLEVDIDFDMDWTDFATSNTAEYFQAAECSATALGDHDAAGCYSDTSSQSGYQPQRPLTAIERYVVPSCDDPYNALGLIPSTSTHDDSIWSDRQVYNQKIVEHPFPYEGNNYFRRLGSPVETVLSSASGSGYYPSHPVYTQNSPLAAFHSGSISPGSQPATPFGCSTSPVLARQPHLPFEYVQKLADQRALLWSKDVGVAPCEILSYPDKARQVPHERQSSLLPANDQHSSRGLGDGDDYSQDHLTGSTQDNQQDAKDVITADTEQTRAKKAAIENTTTEEAIETDNDETMEDGIDEDPPAHPSTRKSDSDTDPDYKPWRSRTRYATRKQPRRNSRAPRRGSSPAVTPSIKSASSPRITKRTSHHRHNTISVSSISTPNTPKSKSKSKPTTPILHQHPKPNHRPYTCPLTPYGCTSTFATKNEWKRHTISQHIRLGFWRCDLCPDRGSGPNDFNRKDLFTQHLRRMHCGAKGKGKGGSVFDCIDDNGAGASDANAGADTDKKTLKATQTKKTPPQTLLQTQSDLDTAIAKTRLRCWMSLRSGPSELGCAFCGQVFRGVAKCTEEWLEHVGRHLGRGGGGGGIGSEVRDDAEEDKDGDEKEEGCVDWEKDVMLRDWMVGEGLLEARAGGGFALVAGNV